jgi:hypothetical protein
MTIMFPTMRIVSRCTQNGVVLQCAKDDMITGVSPGELCSVLLVSDSLCAVDTSDAFRRNCPKIGVRRWGN